MNRILPAFILSIFLSVFFHTKAATIIVQNVNDSGPGSLRAAVTNAQNGDIIRFNPILLNGGSNTIVLSNYLPVNKPIVIKGLYNQNDTLYISGNNTTQIINSLLMPAVTNSTITLDSLVLINGIGSYYGGAVQYIDYNGSNALIVKNCVFKNNTAAFGGAIGSVSYDADQTIKIENSIIRNCSASGAGGGVAVNSYLNTTLIVTNCDIFENTAQNYGGGLQSFSELTSTVTISGSSIHENSVSVFGGAGISSKALTASWVTVNNSTFNGNTGPQGSAIHSYVSNSSSPISTSTVSLTNCTVTANSATHIGGVYSYCVAGSLLKVTNCTIVGNTNAGLHSESAGTSTEIIKSSIVALNTGWDAGNVSNNAPAPLSSAGFNIFGLISGGVGTDQMNATAAQLNLGPLQFNGGNTKTILPGPGSIAIDMGNPADLSNAQNAPLTGTIRDVGAAEVCSTTYGDTAASTCGPINWYGTIYSASGNYTHQLMNSGGCDSIVTLNLTISLSSETTETETSCGPFVWPLNGQTYGFSGFYTDTVSTVNGCDSIVHLSLTIFSIPDPNVVDNGNGTFTATYSGIVEWIDCAADTVIASGQTFTPTQNGNYAVVVTDGVSSCRDTSNCILVDYLDIESKNLLDLSISPNPTNDFVQILFSGSDAELIVYDVQGKVVLKDRIQNQGTISLVNFERGVYLFDFKNSQGHNVKRVVKR